MGSQIESPGPRTLRHEVLAVPEYSESRKVYCLLGNPNGIGLCIGGGGGRVQDLASEHVRARVFRAYTPVIPLESS